MHIVVMLIVVFAALPHVLWNAAVKSSAEEFLGFAPVMAGAAALSAAAVSVLLLPSLTIWPYIAASDVFRASRFSVIGASNRIAGRFERIA